MNFNLFSYNCMYLDIIILFHILTNSIGFESLLQMSKVSINNDQEIDAPPTNSNVIDGDKLFGSSNMLPIDDPKCYKSMNDVNDLNCFDSHGNNHASNDCVSEIIKTKNLNKFSQLNLTECKYLISLCGSLNANINSQDEKIILNIVEKNKKYIFPSSAELTDMNTQDFMDLNLHRAIHQIQGSQQKIDNSMKLTVEHTKCTNSFSFTPPSMTPLPDGFINFKHDNQDVITTSESEKQQELNNSSSKPNNELINLEEDSEIIQFRAMCEALTKIGTVDKQVKLNSNPLSVVNNQKKMIVLKEVNPDVFRVSDVKCIPSTNKLPSVYSIASNCTNDISKHLEHNRHHSKRSTLNLFSGNSEYSNELLQMQFNNQHKKSKLTLDYISNVQTKCCSKKTENQFNKKVISCIDLLSEDEDECMLSKNQLSKVLNSKKNYKRKSSLSDLLEQNKKKSLIGNNKIIYCSPDGLIHKDMINYINNKNCLKK